VDGRVVTVRITPAGQARYAEVESRRVQLLSHMLKAFSRPERVVLAEMLERFVAALDDFVDHLDT
jgi:DNA-binding MarR family transcriptional regulator